MSPAPATTSTSSSRVVAPGSTSSQAPSSVAVTTSSSSSSSVATGPTCYRTDLHIGPMATGVSSVSCITVTSHVDDYFGTVTLPFNMTIFSITSTHVWLSTNGVSISPHENHLNHLNSLSSFLVSTSAHHNTITNPYPLIFLTWVFWGSHSPSGPT